MTRPPGTRGPNTALRIPETLLARVDAYARRLESLEPGREVTRSEAIRILITRALDSVTTPTNPVPRPPAPPPNPDGLIGPVGGGPVRA